MANATLLGAPLMTLVLILAGCVGSDDAPAAPAQDATASGEAEGEVGAVSGLVTDDEQVPLAGAEVALLPLGLQVLTGADGLFTFEGIAPGDYTLAVAKIGFEARALAIVVVAGQTAEANVALPALEISDFHYTTFPFSGILECTFATPVWVSPCDYPYTAVYYTLQDNGVPTGPLPAEPLNNVWRWNTETAAGSKESLSELTWESTTAATQTMMLIASCPEYDPVIDDCGRWGELADGPSPVRLEWEMPKDETIWMTRVYLPWGDVQVALDQSYDVYQTIFYGGKMPKDFTALPG